eukprot:366969-Alexandrium_andersonii.AAC.1
MHRSCVRLHFAALRCIAQHCAALHGAALRWMCKHSTAQRSEPSLSMLCCNAGRSAPAQRNAMRCDAMQCTRHAMHCAAEPYHRSAVQWSVVHRPAKSSSASC